MTGMDYVVAALLTLGTLLMLLSAIGVLRMPDVYLRLSAASKATSLGAILVLAGYALHAGDGTEISRALATIVFVLVTVPVASHAIARAAYHAGVPLWKETRVDELAHPEKTPSTPVSPPPSDDPASGDDQPDLPG